MHCDKCGAENRFEGATFCKNCHEPLTKESVPVSADNTAADQIIQDGAPDESFDSKVSSPDDDQLDMADPIDFVMGKNLPDDGHVEEGDSGETISPESVEDKVTLYQDDDFKLTVSESGSSILIGPVDDDTVSEDESIESGDESSVSKASSIDSPSAFDTTDGKHLEATRKFRLENIKQESVPPSEEPAKPSETPTKFDLDLEDVKRSKGVVFVTGNRLTLAGGARVLPGDEIIIGEKVFEARIKPKNKVMLFGIISAIAISLVISLFLISNLSIGQRGNLVGIVVSYADGKPLANQTVRIPELGKTAISSQAGFFVFNNVPSGLYTIEYLQDGQAVAEERVTVLGGETGTVALTQGKPKSAPAEMPTPKPALKKNTPEKSIRSSEKVGSEPGNLRLVLSPKDAVAYLDGKPMGVGSNSYKVRPGKYILSVKKKGYQTKSREITVKSDKTLSYEFSLSKAKDTSEKKKSEGELAYENEMAGNYSEALRYYDKTLEKNPRDVTALLGKARCFKAQGSINKATTHYMQAAKVAADRNDTEAQLDALSGIIEIRPNTFTAYYSRGDLLFSIGEYERAAYDYGKVIEIDPRNLRAYYKLGSSYYYDKNYSDALAAFKAAEELNFADPKAQAFLAKTYLAMGDKKNTRKSYEKFKEMASYSTALKFKSDPEWQKVLSSLGVEN